MQIGQAYRLGFLEEGNGDVESEMDSFADIAFFYPVVMENRPDFGAACKDF